MFIIIGCAVFILLLIIGVILVYNRLQQLSVKDVYKRQPWNGRSGQQSASGGELPYLSLHPAQP